MTESWGAIYMPATEANDPSASGFESEEKARAYTRQYWCRVCRSEYARALNWKRKGVDIVEIENKLNPNSWEDYENYLEKYGNFYPSCDAEWIINRTDIVEENNEYSLNTSGNPDIFSVGEGSELLNQFNLLPGCGIHAISF